MRDPDLLASKLREETEELIQALRHQAETAEETESGSAETESGSAEIESGFAEPAEVIHEAADLLYFTLVAAASKGVGVGALRRELAQRSLRVRRRPMAAKPDETRSDGAGLVETKSDEGKPHGTDSDEGELEEGRGR